MRTRTGILAATMALLGMGAFAAVNAPRAVLAEPAAERAAHERSVTFAVENMTCALCPVTVKQAMEAVPGVTSVSIDFEAKTATVLFDPATATAGAIAQASGNVGYPARPAGPHGS